MPLRLATPALQAGPKPTGNGICIFFPIKWICFRLYFTADNDKEYEEQSKGGRITAGLYCRLIFSSIISLLPPGYVRIIGCYESEGCTRSCPKRGGNARFREVQGKAEVQEIAGKGSFSLPRSKKQETIGPGQVAAFHRPAGACAGCDLSINCLSSVGMAGVQPFAAHFREPEPPASEGRKLSFPRRIP